ncbi:hypothetical protein [Alienimonas chondri]|uniref:Uncharacterized protein n=1 Tax=Alienimonas chondri TaxID=2681879 RepID=A0ABX1VCB6_9PLAN|nr:hypothetical protein [Alienimonas chondri]NNJ25749.1 hypothetical protein [Alienimonas chondri]
MSPDPAPRTGHGGSLALPPLPTPTRISVTRADLLPEPGLEVQVAAATSFGGGLLRHVAVGAIGLAMWGAVVALAISAFAEGEMGFAAFLCGCTGVVLVGTGGVFWLMKDETTRLGLTMAPDGVTAEMLWFGRLRTRSLRFDLDGTDRRPRLWDPSPEANVGLPRPLRWRTAEGETDFTPSLTTQDRAWLAAALARCAEANGRPDWCPRIPALVDAPASSADVDSPSLRMLREESGRLTIAWPANMADDLGPTAALLVASLFAVGVVIAVGIMRGIEAEGAGLWLMIALLLSWGTAHWLIKAIGTVRVTIDRGRDGGPRVRRSSGIGPLRVRRTFISSNLRAVSRGFPAAGNPDGAADPLRGCVYLVVRDRPWWLKPFVGGSAVPLLRGTGPRGASLAEAVVGRVRAKLHELGWNADVPADWRFGWEFSSPERVE